MKKPKTSAPKALLTLMILTAMLITQLPLISIGQVRTDKNNRGNKTLNKNDSTSFTVWTDLNLRDLNSVLPRGGTASAAGRNGFLINGITDHIKFAYDIGVMAAGQGHSTPRFGRAGAGDPGEPSEETHELGIALGEALAANFQIANNFPGGNWPKGPFRDPNEMWSLLSGTGYQKDPFVFPPNPAGKGRWVRVCSPTAPCDQPGQPPLEDVDECNDEKREIKRVQRWLDAFDDAIAKAASFLDKMKRAKWANDSIGVVLNIMTIAVVALGPAGALVGFTFAGGAILFDLLKAFLFDKGVDAFIDQLEADLNKLKHNRGLFALAMAEARAALEACLKKAAESEATNAAAWDKFFNVDLPAYYKCLDARRCHWEWVPE